MSEYIVAAERADRRFPKAILSVSREEFYGQDAAHSPLELIVKKGLTDEDGVLPEDLQGHVFIVGPAGTASSPKSQGSTVVVEPSQDGWTPLFNGDGMIYRLDFHKTPVNPQDREVGKECSYQETVGKAWMATRFVNTPSYYADTALQNNPKYKKLPDYEALKFRNLGLARLSFKLGAANNLNTALLRMKFSNQNERLLVTWDAGRPYEVNPCTLAVAAPVGNNTDWKPLIPVGNSGPFRQVLSSAHPQFDANTNEVFTVNATKTLRTLLWLSRLLTYDVKQFSDRFLKNPCLKWFVRLIVRFTIVPLLQFLDCLFDLLKIGGNNSVNLIRWNGANPVQTWEVLLPNGRPIAIKQSMHQMGLTKDYVVLADSAFKLSLEDLLPALGNKMDRLEEIEALFREYLIYPQLPYTDIYLVPRNKLQQGTETVMAKRVRLKPEVAHFLVDYDNPNGKISLHAAHNPAGDPTEFIHRVDSSFYKDPQVTQELRARSGTIGDPMDVSRLGYWSIDPERGTGERVLLSPERSQEFTWQASIYAYRDNLPTRQFDDVYMSCWGCWEELLNEVIFKLYKGYKNRTVPVPTMVDSIIKHGKPASICRLHIDRTTSSSHPELTIADNYSFPSGYFGNSPQFVPRQGSQPEAQTDGYITCVVTHSDNLLTGKTELWIFDAGNLQQGPLFRLSHPKLNIGLTVHSTWFQSLATPPASDYSVREDYKALVQATGSQEVTDLFEEDIYPHYA